MFFQKIIKEVIIILSLSNIYLSEVNAEYSGDITSYGASMENQFCGFKKNSWNYNGMMTAAINAPMMDNSLSCGLCASVKYKEKTVNVLLDNLCPECKFGDLDLSNEAWKELTGNNNYGREKATWEFVDCGNFLVQENAEKGLILKPHHINYWWLSVTPSNMKCGINSMSILFKSDESKWMDMERNNNLMNGLYFIYHNHIVGDFKFKVVSKFGEEMITDWYSEIKDIFYVKKQFKCEEEEECEAYSVFEMDTPSPTPAFTPARPTNCNEG